MFFPLTSSDLSLLLAVVAIILLITSELLYSLPEYSARIGVDKQFLRLAAIGFSLAFLFTVGLRVMGMI
jgi:hypothetical protein